MICSREKEGVTGRQIAQRGLLHVKILRVANLLSSRLWWHIFWCSAYHHSKLRWCTENLWQNQFAQLSILQASVVKRMSRTLRECFVLAKWGSSVHPLSGVLAPAPICLVIHRAFSAPLSFCGKNANILYTEVGGYSDTLGICKIFTLTYCHSNRSIWLL